MSVENCKWLGNEIDCLSSLSYTATSEGWCSTFNMLSYEDIYVIEEYSLILQPETQILLLLF